MHLLIQMRRGRGCDHPCPFEFSKIEIRNKNAKKNPKQTNKQRERKREGKCLRLSIFACIQVYNILFQEHFLFNPLYFSPQKPPFVKNFWIHPRHDHIFIKLQFSNPPHSYFQLKNFQSSQDVYLIRQHYICAATIITISYGSLLVG